MYSNGDDVTDGDNVHLKVIITIMIMKKVHPPNKAIALQEIAINKNGKVSKLTYKPKIRLIILVISASANLFILITYQFQLLFIGLCSWEIAQFVKVSVISSYPFIIPFSHSS